VSNVTPEFMEIIAAASTRTGSDLAINPGKLLMDRRGLAYAAEHLRSLLGAMQMPPTALIAVTSEADSSATAIVAASSPRLNEAWSDLPDQVLSVRKLGYATEHFHYGPALDRRDLVLLVGSLVGDGADFVAAVKLVREQEARIIGGFAVVDLQRGEEGNEAHKAMQEAGMPMFYAVTNKKSIIDYLDRQTMLGKK
jgi:orotate phosphoribosyltransferase